MRWWIKGTDEGTDEVTDEGTGEGTGEGIEESNVYGKKDTVENKCVYWLLSHLMQRSWNER